MDPRIERTKAAVRLAATDLLVEGGPAAVTVDAVVARSGVAKSTIYRHWNTRDELLVDAVQGKVPQLALPPPDLAFEPSLRDAVRTFVAVFEDPEWVRVQPAILLLKLTEESIACLQQEMHDEQRAIFAEIVRRGVAEGAIPPDIDLEELAAHIIGPILFAQVNGAPPIDVAFGDRVVDRFLAWAGALVPS
jgi:AcrR family transcriptional regulator